MMCSPLSLPEAVMVKVLSFLDDVRACMRPRILCRELDRVICGDAVVRGVADQFELHMPLRTRRTRLREDPVRALRNAYGRQKISARQRADRACWQLWIDMHKADVASRLNKAVTADPTLANHRIAFFEHRTLAMLAAWRGRRRCLETLLGHGAEVDAADDRDFSPLLFAAWAGHPKLVRVIIKHQVNLARTGEPPQSSSCGGRGPKTALEWAKRKGHASIVRDLERAGAAEHPTALK